MITKPEAILILKPVTNYLSIDVYCCIVIKTFLKSEEDLLKHLNLHYSTFVDAVNLVSIGQIDDLLRMKYDKNRHINNSFPSLNAAKETLKDYPLYFYDMSEKKYKWIKL